jgi:UPF0755 protein
MTGPYASDRPPGRGFRGLLALLRGLLALLSAAVLFLLYAFYWPNTFTGAGEKAFYVHRGEAYTQLVDSLASQGVIRDRRLFALVAGLHGGATKLQVGKYLFRSGVTNDGVFQSLRTGKGAVMIAVTLREGLTLRHQARILARSLGIDSLKFLSVAGDTGLASGFGFGGATLEGFLMPDTYAFGWQPEERDVIRRMVEEFRRFYADSLERRASALGLTTRQVVTMASLVEGETHLSEERPVVAGVYYNRLRRGMRLEADPAIQYLLEGGPRRLSYADLGLDSPYNTYRHAGLPPGPVNSPGRASILAALYPAHHQFLFFVANGRGGHWFSTTYEEHLRNVRRARMLRKLAEAGDQRAGTRLPWPPSRTASAENRDTRHTP